MGNDVSAQLRLPRPLISQKNVNRAMYRIGRCITPILARSKTYMSNFRAYFSRAATLLALGFVGYCPAKDVFVAQEACGADTGLDLTNVHSVAWLNAPANWGVAPDKISPGDSIHLVGEISTSIVVQGSGISVNRPTTLLFEAGAKMSSPAWPNSGAIVVNRKDFITIDGGAGGIIENTANGELLANQIDSFAVKAVGANYFTVQNLTVRNLYVRREGPDRHDYGRCISNQAVNAPNMTGFKVLHCTLSDAYVGIDSDYNAGCSDYEFAYNTVFNCNWGGRCGDRSATSTMTGLSVHHNRFSNWTNWNEPVANAYHHNGFFGWGASGGKLSNARVYSNTIGPGFGGKYQTSGIYFSGTVSSIYVFNNLFIESSTDDYPANGLVTVRPEDGYHSEFYIFNNTMIGGGSGIAIYIAGGNGVFTVKNNLIINTGSAIGYFYNTAATLVCDSNLGYRLRPSLEYISTPTGTSKFFTSVQWQAAGYGVAGLHLDGQIDDPMLGTDNRPNGASAIGTGENLWPIFQTDMDDRPRSEDGKWDIGALNAPDSKPTVTVAVTIR